MTYASILQLYLSNCEGLHADHEIIPFRVTEYDFGDSPVVKMKSEGNTVEVVWRHEEGITVNLLSIKKSLFFTCAYGLDKADEIESYDVSVHEMWFTENEFGKGYWHTDIEGAEFEINEKASKEIEDAAYAPFINAEVEEEI